MRIGFVAPPLLVLVCALTARAGGPQGYYRQPAIHGDTIVFVTEGDLWKVSAQGGVATRLTSHPGQESMPALSPDGQTVAFLAQYEGPTDLYTMPLAGGQARRWTYEGSLGASSGGIGFVGWTPTGKILYASDRQATLPSQQLWTIDFTMNKKGIVGTPIPLAQAADGCYDETGTLYFTRLPFQGSHTKRYQGGTAQNLWKFAPNAAEAAPLTSDYAGTSKHPMCWHGRVYFASDRDGTMNLWSMKPDGHDLRQHTHHSGWDVQGPALDGGKIVYQLGADLRLYDIEADTDRLVPITLESDLDQTREHWVKKPIDYLTAAHLAPDGNRVVLTARGQVFVAPRKDGRFVQASHHQGVRYRDARFLPDGKSLLVLSDQSGEVEFWKLAANGDGPSHQLTQGATVLRVEGIPSPDGAWIAHRDKDQRLWVYEVASKKNRKIDESKIDPFSGLTWSPDSRWLAYVGQADNMFQQIKLYHVTDGKTTVLTSDRFDSFSPAWSPDGKWLYFLSDRRLQSLVPSPWGNYAPEPFFDKRTRVYQLALTKGLRSPFAEPNELTAKQPATEAKKPDPAQGKGKKTLIKIDLAGIRERLLEIPLRAGNYRSLTVNDKALFLLSRPTDAELNGPGRSEGIESLIALPISNDHPRPKTVSEKVNRYELSLDGKSLLLRKGDRLYIVDAAPAPADLAHKMVDLSSWGLAVMPRAEWRQMFTEAWRLERDYFYDRAMHGIDWKGIRTKYQPLVERVHSREELSDLIAQMVSELSALHIFVRGGDMRSGEDKVPNATLGAVLQRDEGHGGYRVVHIRQSDPDRPELRSPLRAPTADVHEGDCIERVNGVRTLSVPDIGQLLRRQAGEQVLLHVQPAGGGAARDVVVKPLSTSAAADRRYHEWEYTRRLQVEKLGKGQLGYVHLRAMSTPNIAEWAREFYPVFDRQGLIIDVRHNRGGNIDSWIIGRLLRRAWFYWSPRVGQPPLWNMQYAFRGHAVILCDEFTASDGEAFTEGIKRLKLGKVIGTRTWGGEIWLSFNNYLVDRGIASAAEMGVYGPEGTWLIEGHGVDPDVVVDNLPHATYQGDDAQLQAAIRYLQKEIAAHPVTTPAAPVHPNKSFRPKARQKSPAH